MMMYRTKRSAINPCTVSGRRQKTLKIIPIKIEYVNPKYTSQKCPVCGELNKANDRNYKCGCGYKIHRDRLGAINIISATVADGKSLPA